MLVNLYKLALLATSLLPIASTLPSPSAPVPSGDPDRIPGKYIVTLRKGLDAPAVKQHMSFVQGVHARSNSGHSGVGRQWSLDLWNGYAGYFDEHTAEQIRKHENVQSVEPDRARHLYGALQVQGQAEWGLTALSHKSLNASATEYVYDNRAGEGGYAYIIDTG